MLCRSFACADTQGPLTTGRYQRLRLSFKWGPNGPFDVVIEVFLEDYIKPMRISVRALSLALHVPYSR